MGRAAQAERVAAATGEICCLAEVDMFCDLLSPAELDVAAAAPMKTCFDAEQDLEREDVHVLDESRAPSEPAGTPRDGFHIPVPRAGG